MDFQLLPKPRQIAGSYKMQAGGGLEMQVAIYGVRKKYLEFVDKTMTQVQVEGFGGYYWINVDPNDITLGELRWENSTGEWGYLPQEPCRFCHQIECVHFRADDSPLDKNAPQVARCDKCKRDWEVTSSSA